MKTTTKLTALIIAAVITVKAATALRQTYNGLQHRYATEARGKALEFINSQMY